MGGLPASVGKFGLQGDSTGPSLYRERTRLSQEGPFGVSSHRRGSQSPACAVLVKYIRKTIIYVNLMRDENVFRPRVC